MSRKIMILTGSPRKTGNTNTLASWVADAARTTGAEVDLTDVSGLDYAANGCTACMSCQKNDDFRCVIKDEASELLARMPEADIVAFATPVYFFGPTAQLKLILDRTYSLFKFDLETGEINSPLKGKHIALITSAGGRETDGMEVVKATFQHLAAFLGTELRALTVPNAPRDPGAIAERDDLKQQAEAFGKWLAG